MKDDVLFIDEIHRNDESVEEILYPKWKTMHDIIGRGQVPEALELRLKNLL